MESNLWESARVDFETNVMPQLKAEGTRIRESARGGDHKALEVIELYTRLHRSFDPVTLELLKEALNSYVANLKSIAKE